MFLLFSFFEHSAFTEKCTPSTRTCKLRRGKKYCQVTILSRAFFNPYSIQHTSTFSQFTTLTRTQLSCSSFIFDVDSPSKWLRIDKKVRKITKHTAREMAVLRDGTKSLLGETTERNRRGRSSRIWGPMMERDMLGNFSWVLAVICCLVQDKIWLVAPHTNSLVKKGF